MRRGRTQAIYRYLPESIIDHTDTQTIAKVSGWRVREIQDININRLMEEMSRKMRVFKSTHVYPGNPQPRDFAIVEPTSIEVELFPLTFICRKCGKVSSYRSLEQMSNSIGRNNYTCSYSNCRGTLDQMDLVHYHNCGKIDGLAIRGCKTHGYDSIILNKYGSNSIQKWRWTCTICHQPVGRVGNRCMECNEYMKTSPFRKSDVMYPQSVILINVSGSNKSPTERKLSLAAYLDLIAYEKIGDVKSRTELDQKISDVEQKIQELRDEGIPEESLTRIRDKFLKSEQHSEDNITSQLDKLLKIDDDRIATTINAIQDFIDTKNLEFVHSLSDIEIEAKQTNNPAAPIIATFQKKFDDVGIQNVWVIGDFPVLRSVYGYTRGDADPKNCILRSFPLIADQFPGRTPIYSVATETEAILLELDRNKILQWIQDNGLADNVPVNESTEIQKAWFLNNINIDSIPIYDEISDEEILTKSVYTLIHSMSHSLINYASSLIGLDKSSLAEILLPNVPAIIIYCNQVTDFQLGGMFTLMESGVISWIESAVNGIENCLYDPICIDSTGSCHACLHASEITCEHFNRDLSRSILLGKKGEFKGFWEHLYA